MKSILMLLLLTSPAYCQFKLIGESVEQGRQRSSYMTYNQAVEEAKRLNVSSIIVVKKMSIYKTKLEYEEAKRLGLPFCVVADDDIRFKDGASEVVVNRQKPVIEDRGAIKKEYDQSKGMQIVFGTTSPDEWDEAEQKLTKEYGITQWHFADNTPNEYNSCKKRYREWWEGGKIGSFSRTVVQAQAQYFTQPQVYQHQPQYYSMPASPALCVGGT